MSTAAAAKQEVNPFVQKYEVPLNLMARRTQVLQRLDAMIKEFEQKDALYKSLPRELQKLRRDIEAEQKEELQPLDKELIASLEKVDKQKPLEVVTLADIKPAPEATTL